MRRLTPVQHARRQTRWQRTTHRWRCHLCIAVAVQNGVEVALLDCARHEAVAQVHLAPCGNLERQRLHSIDAERFERSGCGCTLSQSSPLVLCSTASHRVVLCCTLSSQSGCMDFAHRVDRRLRPLRSPLEKRAAPDRERLQLLDRACPHDHSCAALRVVFAAA